MKKIFYNWRNNKDINNMFELAAIVSLIIALIVQFNVLSSDYWDSILECCDLRDNEAFNFTSVISSYIPALTFFFIMFFLPGAMTFSILLLILNGLIEFLGFK